MKIYVASSWRNDLQPEVVWALRSAGHSVYDFRNPVPGRGEVRWSDIDPQWKEWGPGAFRDALQHPLAEAGFGLHMQALARCDVCVLVMSCGRSAHLEAGYAIGAGKPTVILLSDGQPELMYKMAFHICTNVNEIIETCGALATTLRTA